MAGALAPGGDLYATEGATKANVAHHLSGSCFFAVAGQALAPEHIDVIKSLRPGRVVVALDQEQNTNTDRARERWLRALWHAGLATYMAVWEGADLGGPKGIDDLFFSGGRPRLRAVHFVPSSFGEKRAVREATEKGTVTEGLSLVESRRLVDAEIDGFIAAVGRRR